MEKSIQTVFLFPGQGSQYAGMALDFYESLPRAQSLFERASDAAQVDLHALITEGDADTLKRTGIAQSAITLANLCAVSALTAEGISPSAAAGHSLGEYAALAVSGVISEEDCFTLVAARGRAMEKAASRCPSGSGMAAVLGLDGTTVEQLIAQWQSAGEAEGLYAANFNTPRQTVISGTAAALEMAEHRFKEAGARRVIRLAVQGPFHSPLMAQAAEEFSAALEAVPFADPRLPLFSNVTGARVLTGAEAKRLAISQIVSPVRWTAEESAIAALGINAAVEAGPGTVLTGLWKESGSAARCHPAGTAAAVKSAADALHGGQI